MIVLDEDAFVPAESLLDELEHVCASGRPSTGTSAFQGQLRTVSEADAELLRERIEAAARAPAPRRVIHERHFTLEEANALLAAGRADAARAARGPRPADRRRGPRAARRAPRPPTAAASPGAQVGEAFLEVRELLGELQELGIVVRDIDRGLIDFPAIRDEREVYLCWELDEDEIAFWHDLESGFGGRQPLDERPRGATPAERIVGAGAIAVAASLLLPWYGIAFSRGLSVTGLDRFGFAHAALLITVGAAASWSSARRPAARCRGRCARPSWSCRRRLGGAACRYLIVDRPDELGARRSARSGSRRARRLLAIVVGGACGERARRSGNETGRPPGAPFVTWEWCRARSTPSLSAERKKSRSTVPGAPALASEVPPRKALRPPVGSYGVMGAVGESLGGRNSPTAIGRYAHPRRRQQLDVCSTLRSAASSGERPDELAVVVVVEQLERLREPEPAQLVDLVAGDELAAERSHQPPADELVAALAVAIARRRRARGRARSAGRSPPRPRAAPPSSHSSPGSSLPFGSDQSS